MKNEKLSNIMNKRWKDGIYGTIEHRKNLSNAMKKRIMEKGHPRGMLGKRQSLKAIKNSSEMCKKRIRDKHPNWKGGKQAYWNQVARQVIRYLPNECLYCKKKSIIVHHIDWDITNNNLDNLIKVCRSCHKKICHKEQTLLIIEKMNKIKKDKQMRRKDILEDCLKLPSD
jgi:hypothetical protein